MFSLNGKQLWRAEVLTLPVPHNPPEGLESSDVWAEPTSSQWRCRRPKNLHSHQTQELLWSEAHCENLSIKVAFPRLKSFSMGLGIPGVRAHAVT